MKLSKETELNVGRWFVEVKWFGWKVVCLNFHFPRWSFGYEEDWYDGPHKAYIIGPFNIYWNF